MILVGIDVAKDKHDCFIQTADGKVLYKAFSFANNYEGFEELYAKILSYNDSEIRGECEKISVKKTDREVRRADVLRK